MKLRYILTLTYELRVKLYGNYTLSVSIIIILLLNKYSDATAFGIHHTSILTPICFFVVYSSEYTRVAV